MKDFKHILLVILLFFGVVSHASADGTFYLLRHAEKQIDGTNDPHLTKKGHERATLLAQQLSLANISKIYSTDYKRTQETVKPLADLFGLSVELYDPVKLEEFTEVLKTQTGQIVVVGHSNTTPSLTALLSGTSVDGIDDSEYENLYQVVLVDDEARLNRFRIFPIESTPPITSIAIDAKRFKSGVSTFNVLFRGEVVGQSMHTLKKKKGSYQLHEKTIVDTMGINADIDVIVNNETVKPVSMSMTGSMGGAVDIDLTWQGSKVAGHSEMARASHHPQGRLNINQELASHTVERTSLIMLAHLLDVAKGHTQSINWFNGYNGFSREILISHEGEQKVTVPAGDFETYKVLYQGGAPSQLFYISKGKHPQIVKIEIPTMAWTYELAKPR